jgi:hypothetical protein
MQLDRTIVDQIMAPKSGQKRINQLFRSSLGRVVGRASVATVAQQNDYMKRVRANGGARTALQNEGIVILGHYSSHTDIARGLGLPVPGQGDSLSVRLAPARTRGSGIVEIRGRLWRVATPADPVMRAPDLPRI